MCWWFNNWCLLLDLLVLSLVLILVVWWWSDCGCDGLVLVLFDSCVGFYFVVLC